MYTLRIQVEEEGKPPLGLALKFDAREFDEAGGKAKVGNAAVRTLRSVLVAFVYRLEGLDPEKSSLTAEDIDQRMVAGEKWAELLRLR